MPRVSYFGPDVASTNETVNVDTDMIQPAQVRWLVLLFT